MIGSRRDRALAAWHRLHAAVIGARAEIAVGVALLAGWALVTHGVAELLPRGQVWSLSTGFLLLSLVGWRFLWTVVSAGLYTLSMRGGRRG